MKKDTVWLVVAIFLLVGVVGGLIWIFSGSPDLEEDISEQSTTTAEEVSDEEEDSGGEEDSSEGESVFDEVGDDSAISYSSESQKVGAVTDTMYILEEVTVKKGSEFVEINFVLNSEDETDDGFEVTASNSSKLGVLDIRVKGVSEYSADLSYGSKIDVNHEGISGFSKIIESVENEERFYLGCNEAVEFFIADFITASDGSIVAKIYVKYPGGEISEEESGTKEFTSEDLSFEGNDVDGGARIIDYDYIYSSGSLKFGIQVSTSSDIVTPSFESNLTGGVLEVVFPSLVSDSVYGWGSTIELPRGVVLEISRAGNVSTYTFSGVGSTYRVFGESSPNQVIIDMSL